MGDSPGSHSLIKLDDHAGVEKPMHSHERLQGVSLHKPHGVSKLGKGDERWKIIKILVVQILATTVGIAWNRATIEDRSPNNGARRIIQRNVKNWTLWW